MLCPHGNLLENCIHCTMGDKVKPEQLVKLAPREIPMELIAKKELEKGKDLHDQPIFENNTLSINTPKRLGRNFDVASSAFESKPSLLGIRMQKLQGQQDIKEFEHFIGKEEKLIDLKKKYLH